ncbi:glycosyltransferase [Massilimicrobiota sp. SW1139]|uniref:glycosyltransferase family 2 protein n=1 Tax=Massilimicrobiota sp. SW1139 TaxID=2530043 RepID=UPI00143B8DC5|nr:glycosyltransferase [Massilimicrobiota sp. SW1139]NJE45754.1 glycosyltransferase [Massilimicrobiota sp. SW1139]
MQENMLNTDMISVVVPVYNVEKYLEECIESILKQVYTNYEIILVDDGSTDSSGNICDFYALNFPNIQVIHKNNEGLGMARNTGIERAKGDYITFIDSDDYVDENLLLDLISNIKKCNADVCLGGFKKVSDDKKILFTEQYNMAVYYHNGVTNDIFIKMLGSLPNKHDVIRMSVCNTLFKLSIINKYNLRFLSEREYISEDLLFDLDYYLHANKCILLNNINYNYRYNPSSLTTSYKKDRFNSTIKFFEYLEQRLYYYKFNDESILRMKKMFFVYLRSCIKQEKIKVSEKTFFESISNIKNMCNNNYVKKIINTYPYFQLNFKQMFFILLIKLKVYYLLYFLL